MHTLAFTNRIDCLFNEYRQDGKDPLPSEMGRRIFILWRIRNPRATPGPLTKNNKKMI